MRTLLLIIVLSLQYSVMPAQKSTDVYASGSVQIAYNKKNFTGDANLWNLNYYNSVMAGVIINKTLVLGIEYSAIIYRWTDRVKVWDFLEYDDDEFENDDDSPPTHGEKFNNYKVFTQVFPFNNNGIFIGGGWGYCHFRNFRTPNTQKYGTSYSFHIGFESKENVGLILSYYKGSLKRSNESYNFSSFNMGIVVSTGRFYDSSKDNRKE